MEKWHLALFGVSVTLFVVLGLIQLTGANPFLLYPEGYNYYGANIYYSGAYWSTLGNVNFCAAFLSLVAGACTAALILRTDKREWFLFIPLCLCVFSIFVLHSDSGMVALLLGLLFLPSFCVRSSTHLANVCQVYSALSLTVCAAQVIHFQDGGVSLKFPKTAILLILISAVLTICWLIIQKNDLFSGLSPKVLRWSLLLAALILLLAAFAFLYFYTGFSANSTLFQIHELLHGQWDDSFGSGRLYIWRQALALVREAPLFGGGPDTLAQRGLEGFSRYNEVLQMTVSSEIDAAHNEYLNILVNTRLR
ncbi:MAG: O-antigen ligase family protein [Eubacteriales bacterium]|nr:O-antigen ligase family protein [Eubacteriales bacterium]